MCLTQESISAIVNSFLTDIVCCEHTVTLLVLLFLLGCGSKNKFFFAEHFLGELS